MNRVRDVAGSSLGRILIGFTLVTVVFAGAWLWSLSGPLTDAVVRQQERNLTAVAQAAALVVTQSEGSPTDVTRQLVARTDIRMTIVAANGAVLADTDTDPSTMENHADRPEIADALDGGVGTDRRVSATEGTEQVYVAVPATFSDKRIAVRVSQPLDEIRGIAATWRRVGLALLVMAAVVALAIVVPVARAATRPIGELSQTAGRMAAGDLSARVPSVPSDLRELADALEALRSQMRARIEALEDERITLRGALDGLADAIFVLDEGRVTVSNRAADRMFRPPSGGWEGSELEGPGLPASVQASIQSLVGSTAPEVRELDPDPTGRALRVFVAPLSPERPESRVIVALSDITERMRLDRVRRDFVSNASHELKTPVAGIGLLAQSAEMAASDGDDKQAVEFARRIEAEVVRLQRLVGDLLDLSRLESTPAPDSMTDVRQAVELALVSHRPAAAGKQLELETDFSEIAGRDVFAAADPTDAAIALDNLLDNAINYTDEGSVRVSVGATEDSVEICVVDTGRGIAAEHLPRIFERFYRVDAGRSRESGGTGLGLALVKHVAERNAGSVTVHSTVATGSTFCLTLRRIG